MADDDKAWGGDKNEGQCTTCGGSGTVTTSTSDANGNTVTKREDCGSCGGSGKR